MSRWPLKKSTFWQQAPIFRLLLPVIMAIVCYDRGWLDNSGRGLVPLFLFSLPLFFLTAMIRRRTWLLQLVTFLLLNLVFFAIGWWRVRADDLSARKDWFPVHAKTAGAYLVQVINEPADKERIRRMKVSVLSSIGDSGSRITSGRAWLNIYKNDTLPAIAPHDVLLVPGDWQPVRNSGNPFEFDYAGFCRRQQITHQQFITGDQLTVYRKTGKTDIGMLEQCHHFCRQQLDKYMADSTTKGILQAMLLGDERDFDPALRQAYADTGVIHIVSISGSHVGMLFLVITGLLFWLKGKRGKLVQYMLGVTAIWIYVLMAGAPPSAVRSALMFSIIAISTLTEKQTSPLNTLLLAAFALLLANPMWLFAVGFQLSFTAVLSLLLFFKPLYLLWPQKYLVAKWLWTCVCGSLAAELLTAPLSIYYFHNFPLFFIAANILAAVLLGVIAMIGGMGIILFCWFPAAAKVISWCVSQCVHGFNHAIWYMQSRSPLSFKLLHISGVELLLLYAIIIAFSVFLLRKQNMALLAGMGAACLLLLLFSYDKLQVLRQEKLIVYNISKQAVAELIRGRGYLPLLRTDTSQNDYITRQTHIALHAWHKINESPGPGCFLFKGRKVLLLDEETDGRTAGDFPVDLLIISHSLKGLSPGRITKTFHPEIVVVNGIQSRWLIRKWKDSCAALGQPFHATTTAGAFVLE